MILSSTGRKAFTERARAIEDSRLMSTSAQHASSREFRAGRIFGAFGEGKNRRMRSTHIEKHSNYNSAFLALSMSPRIT